MSINRIIRAKLIEGSNGESDTVNAISSIKDLKKKLIAEHKLKLKSMRDRNARRLWEGRKRAWRSAKASCISAMGTEINKLQVDLESHISSALRKLKQSAVNLSFDAAKQIISQEIESRPKGLKSKISVALERLIPGTEVQVEVNPAHAEDLKSLSAANDKVQIVAEPDVLPGNARVKTSFGCLEIDWQRSLNQLRNQCCALSSAECDK